MRWEEEDLPIYGSDDYLNDGLHDTPTTSMQARWGQSNHPSRIDRQSRIAMRIDRCAELGRWSCRRRRQDCFQNFRWLRSPPLPIAPMTNSRYLGSILIHGSSLPSRNRNTCCAWGSTIAGVSSYRNKPTGFIRGSPENAMRGASPGEINQSAFL